MKKLISIFIAAVMAVQMLVCTSGAAPADLPSGNLLGPSDFDSEASIDCIDARKHNLAIMKDGDDGYLYVSGMTVNYQGILYKLANEIPAGNYKFTAYFKTAAEGSLTHLRVNFRDSETKTTNVINVYPTSDGWLKVETYINVATDIKDIWINGGGNAAFIQPYFLDNMSLEKVSGIPSGGNITTFGEPITPEEATASYDASKLPKLQPSAAGMNGTYTDTPDAVPSGNLLTASDFAIATSLRHWKSGTQYLEFMESDGGYLKMSGITVNFAGFTYTPDVKIPAGAYKFTGYFKTVDEGALTSLRVVFTDKTAVNKFINVYPISDKWIKVEAYIELAEDLKEIKVCGGTDSLFVQSYYIDNFSLEAVASVPTDAPKSFGIAVTGEEAAASVPVKEIEYEPYVEGEYEVQGIMINMDDSGFVKSCQGKEKEDIVSFVRQLDGSHITDYLINVNSTVVTYPSEVWTDFIDKYYQKTENGISVDYSENELLKAAKYLYEEKGIDYISVFTEELPKIGINAWLSFRMNDVHRHGEETAELLSDFYHGHPEIRRVQYPSKQKSAFAYAMDYSCKSVRDYMLALIDEALARYDVYGIELDYQRDIWLWSVGGEQAGVDVLTDFMRDVNATVAKYEEKYGHEIKISVRTASDVQTTFEFGLDVPTWAAEGLVDLVTPTGRFTTTDNDIPVAHWRSILAPYGVELAPGIDSRIMSAGTNKLGEKSLYTVTAISANYLSAGADKVYFFNMFRTLGAEPIEADDRVTTSDNTLSLLSAKGYWNLITTCGSYDKLMTVNRRVILTYNDTYPIWEAKETQLPKSAMKGREIRLHIPVGDVPETASLYVKFSVNSDSFAAEGNRPTVSVNGYIADYVKVEYIPEYTNSAVLVYKAPTKAVTDGYLTVTVVPTKEFLTVDHAEALIESSKGAAAPTKDETAPSSWAISEVDAAVKAGIVPSLLRRNYRDTVTRLEFCTLIMTMIREVSGASDSRALLEELGIGYVDSFSDTDSSDVVAASLLGIVNGRGGGIFDPYAGITRQEAAKMLASTAAVLGVKSGKAPAFSDLDKAGSWAVESINLTASIVSASGKNVMGGVGDNRFDPLGAYTREQSVLTVYRLYDSIPAGAKLTAKAVSAEAVDSTERVSPMEVKPAGTQGIVLRASADELDASALSGTDVTEVVLTLGTEDAAALIKSLRSMGIKVYVSVSSANAANEAKAAVKKYSIDGIEVDFVRASFETFSDNTAALKAAGDALGGKYRISVRVPSDVMTCHNLCLDVVTWARLGLCDMICPSFDAVSDTDMPVRLWYSLLYDYGVILAPVIGGGISVGGSYAVKDASAETLTAEAMYALSFGADRVSVNYSAANAASLAYVGSYAKLLGQPMRMTVTYNDITAAFESSGERFPLKIADGASGVIRIPLGDTAADAKVYVRIAYQNYGVTEEAKKGTVIYANSVICNPTGEAIADPMTGYTLYAFAVPQEALNMGHLVLEIMANNGAVSILHAEAFVSY